MNMTTADSTIQTMVAALSDEMNPARAYECGQTLLRWREGGFPGLTAEQVSAVVQAIDDHGLI
jgi:hypothetical protein